MDILLPEVICLIIMDVFNVSRNEVSIVLSFSFSKIQVFVSIFSQLGRRYYVHICKQASMCTFTE